MLSKHNRHAHKLTDNVRNTKMTSIMPHEVRVNCSAHTFDLTDHKKERGVEKKCSTYHLKDKRGQGF